MGDESGLGEDCPSANENISTWIVVIAVVAFISYWIWG